MRDTVLVRGTMRSWDCVTLLALGVVVIGLGVWAMTARLLVLAVLAGALGLVMLLVASVAWLLRVRQRQWARDLGNGFLLLDHDGDREVRDDDVLMSSVHFKNHYSGGIFNGYTRILRVWLGNDEDARPEQVTMTSSFGAREADPLAGLIERVGNRLVAEAEDYLRQDLSVQGEFWKWERGKLFIREARQTRKSAIADLAVVEIVDGHVCIWRHGQDEVWARVPQGSANAYVLERLLAKELSSRSTPPPLPTEDGLGRIIFERHGRKNAVASFALAVVAALVGLVLWGLLPFGAFGRDVLAPILIGAGCLVGAGLLVLLGYHYRIATFRCHENGVFQRGLASTNEMRYEDVRTFTYSAVRVFVNGVYSGTNLSMSFERDGGGKRIAFTRSIPNPDQSLDDLRDHVARVVAGKMDQRLNRGERVSWTPQMTFYPDGLLCRPAGWFKAKSEDTIPYDEIANYQINEGYFFLWIHGKKKPLVSESVGVSNFFPGFFLLLSVLSRNQPPEATAGDTAEG